MSQTGVDYVARMQRQRCKACWNADGFDFHVSDETWAAVVPPALRNHVVCLKCFDDFAVQAGVDYEGHLETIYFAGNRAAFVFSRVRD